MELPLHVIVDDGKILAGTRISIVDHKATILFSKFVNTGSDHAEVYNKALSIVKSVNNHDRLVEALRELMDSSVSPRLRVKKANALLKELETDQ